MMSKFESGMPAFYSQDGSLPLSWELCLGNPNTAEHVLMYQVRFSTTTRYPGWEGITQTCTLDYSDTTQFAFDEWKLDGDDEFYYKNSISKLEGLETLVANQTMDDMPSNTGWLPVRLKGDFIDYLRFRPDTPDSIWVTLGIVTWSMHGVFAEVDGIFTYTTNQPPIPSDIKYVDDFPFYEDVFAPGTRR